MRQLHFKPITLVLIGIALAFLFMIRLSSSVVEGVRYYNLLDDAMISMRYAYNLANGHGLVWNIGEHVEGFTNLGWTLVAALVHLLKLPLRYNSLAVQLINLVLHVSLTYYVYTRLQKRVSAFASLAAALLIGFSLPLFYWSVCGFETSLQTLLITVAFLDLLIVQAGDAEDQTTLTANVAWVPVLCALAYFVRPDAIVFYTTGTAIVLYRIVRANAGAQRRLKVYALLSICAGAALIAAILMWQRSYYGSYLPNTYYLKMGLGARHITRAIKYFRDFSVGDGQFVYIIGTALFLWGLAANPKTRGRAFEAALVICAWFAYILNSGGDVFSYSRFFTPVLPLMIVSTVLYATNRIVTLYTVEDHGANRWRINLRTPDKRWETVVLVVILLLLEWQPVLALGETNFSMHEMAQYGRSNIAVAVVLRRLYPESVGKIGVFWAGTTPYFMPKYTFHDMLGKSDSHIAHEPAKVGEPGHNKWDYEYSLGKIQPALIVTNHPILPEDVARKAIKVERSFVFDYALMLDPLFLKYYKPHQVPIELTDGTTSARQVYARTGVNTIPTMLASAWPASARLR